MLSFQPGQTYRANLKDAWFVNRITKKLIAFPAKIYVSGIVRNAFRLLAAQASHHFGF
jgi:hypothetical protein